MVLVEDVTGQQSGSSSSSTSPPPPPQQPQSNQTRTTLQQFIINDKISFILWLTRLFTIVCSFLFIIPLTGYDQQTLYQKALLGSAATSALKLHQRRAGTGFQLSREYFQNLVIEDSFHYLLYSIIFLNSYPITIVLMPVCLFAILHVGSYTKGLLHFASATALAPLRKAVNFIVTRDKEIMRFAAINEIILMPCIVLMLFSGKCGLFMPFVFYRFICFRYQSRRNPYNKQMFNELRLSVEYYTSQPNCPAMIKNLSSKMIAFVCRLAPQ